MLIEKRNFLHACVNVPVYIMYVCAGACRVQKAWDPLKLELEAFMSRLKWRLVLLSLLASPKEKHLQSTAGPHKHYTWEEQSSVSRDDRGALLHRGYWHRLVR